MVSTINAANVAFFKANGATDDRNAQAPTLPASYNLLGRDGTIEPESHRNQRCRLGSEELAYLTDITFAEGPVESISKLSLSALNFPGKTELIQAIRDIARIWYNSVQTSMAVFNTHEDELRQAVDIICSYNLLNHIASNLSFQREIAATLSQKETLSEFEQVLVGYLYLVPACNLAYAAAQYLFESSKDTKKHADLPIGTLSLELRAVRDAVRSTLAFPEVLLKE